MVGFWKDKELTGVELMIFDPRRFVAVRSAVEILVAVRDLFPRAIDIASVSQMDRDWGTDSIRQSLSANKTPEEILDQWSDGVARFDSLRRRYLLY
jgi:uncharacterized protein YbbC (DUF1343 family)